MYACTYHHESSRGTTVPQVGIAPDAVFPSLRSVKLPGDSHRTLVCGLDFDLDVDARGEIQLHQGVDGPVRRVENVDQPLV